ncbi:hypothetical protein D2E25_1800 [Bifidobacterium goeldii]|uniref:Uncharacterized protein n=1 Tax=Bifidobacterium goeldii TaxID=2306975 RepID=A0A430FEV5_9BIFI|nr:hypothetical protein [Bifidobacterium goeldii]RSX51366.1 hypothetical protein D2E25_1800 [Bifidobacterium goeldii]
MSDDGWDRAGHYGSDLVNDRVAGHVIDSVNSADSATNDDLADSVGWVRGDAKLARKMWFRRRRGWLLAMFLTFSVGIAALGILAWLFGGDLPGVTVFHSDGIGPSVDKALVMLFTVILPCAVAILYLIHRLKGRPQGIVAVRAQWEGVRLIARPDGTDSDGDTVTHNIHTVIFVPADSSDRVVYVPAMYGDHFLRCVFRVRGDRIRLEGFRELTLEQKTAYLKDREYGKGPKLLDEHCTYDEQTEALLVR